MSRGPVVVPIAIARCPATRTKACAVSADCAHALADPKGRDVRDFSTEPRSSKGCIYFMDAGPYRQAAAGQPAPTVHEAPPGIFRG